MEEINQLYRTTVCEEYYVNPNVDGVLSWRIITSCVSDSDTILKNWQQRLHEVCNATPDHQPHFSGKNAIVRNNIILILNK
jgi:hypothetical protein